MTAIELGGERLELLPERALWWEARRTLVCSDVHIGKDRYFRNKMQYVPQDSTREDLERLRALLGRRGAARLWILGDLIHNFAVLDAAFTGEFSGFFRGLDIEILLVAGNHDRRVGAFCVAAGIGLEPESREEAGIRFAHHVEIPDRSGGPSVSGHWHPVVKLKGFADQVRVPCFARVGDALVLPAFGSFTGGFEFEPGRGRAIYAVGRERVVQVGREAPEPKAESR